MDLQKPLVRALALVASAAALSASGAAAEQRCDDLGAACLCEESFDVASMVQNGNPVTFATYDPDGGVKECGDAANGPGNPISAAFGPPDAWQLVPTAGAGLSYALPGVAHVLRQAAAQHGSWMNGRADLVTTLHRRTCMRMYMDRAGAYNFGGLDDPACNRDKLTEPAWVPPNENIMHGQAVKPHSFQFEWRGIGASLWRSSGTEVIPDDCLGQLCRYEMCFDGEVKAGDPSGGQMRITVVTGPNKGKDAVWTGPPVDGMGTFQTMSFNLFRQGTACTGNRILTHLLHAAWTTSEGQWIGPAVEIERVRHLDLGGGSSGETTARKSGSGSGS